MIQQQIKSQIPEAMKAKDELRLLVLRGLATAFMNELVAKKRKPSDELTDDEALEVIRRASKQRKDSIEQFRKGNREDLAQKEEAELKIVESYLPQMMSKEEVEKVARAKKDEMGVTDKSKMGMLMGAIMKDLKGKADGADVKSAVESLF
jgi:uncharacterized protein